MDPRGVYASFGVGVGWPQPVHYADGRLGPVLPIRGTVQVDPGVTTELGLGYDFGWLRGELSWVHREAVIGSSDWSVGPFPAAVSTGGGHVSSNSAFASLYLDFAQQDSRLVPYVGGGLGYTALHTSQTTIQLGGNTATFGGGTSGLLGYQAKAGLAYRSSPRTDLFSEVVYQGAPARSQDSLDRSALNNWGFRLGVRYRFSGERTSAVQQATP
jgi:opacity protein-like surface antigen